MKIICVYALNEILLKIPPKSKSNLICWSTPFFTVFEKVWLTQISPFALSEHMKNTAFEFEIKGPFEEYSEMDE